MNELAGIYKFNAAASIDIRLINSRFNDDGMGRDSQIIPTCRAIVIEDR